MRNVLKYEIRFTSPDPQPGAKQPSPRKVWIDRQSAIYESGGVVEFVGYKGQRISTHTQRYRVIAAEMHGFPGQPDSFGTLPLVLDHPAARLALHVAPRGHAIGRSQTRVEFDRLAKELERLTVRVLGPPTSFRQPTQVIVVRIQIFGWFAPGPLDLLSLQLRGDCTNDAV